MQSVQIQCNTLQPVNWERVPDRPTGNPVTVHKVLIAEFDEHRLLLQSVLKPDELARAFRYHQQKDQRRFIVARSILRLLLAHYSRQSPTAVELLTGVNKKPTLAGFPNLHYNVSHSGSWVLIAIGSTPLGIDVEQIVSDFDYHSILQPSFSVQERQFIDESVASRASFYQLWTRKEALAKATAKGIDDAFHCIPSLDGRYQVAGELLATTTNWLVSSFSAANGYVAAIAYPGSEPQPIQFCAVDHQLVALILPADPT